MAKAKKSDKAAAKELVSRVRTRYPIMESADHDNRIAALEDLRFVFEPGYQWTPAMKEQRGDRPCYEFNELRIKIKRVVNDMRANRPAAKVRGYEDSDKATADIYEGLGRSIWNNSDGDTIIDHAAEYQVGGGMGCWRVCTGYRSDESFDQDLYLESIRNPFCLYWDPAAQDPLKRDAQDWILTERIARKAFEEKYPDAEPVDFDGSEFDDDDAWGLDDKSETVRIAEYWYKEPEKIELWLLNDGRVVEADDPASKALTDQIAKKRVVDSHRVMMVIVSGNAVLEGPTEWAGKEFPFVVVFGEEIILEGRNYWFGLPRFSKDAQRNLNITQTAALEQTSRSLQAPFWATTAQAKGLENLWADAIKKGYPWLPYNHDPQVPGPPSRMAGPELPAAMLALSSQSSALLDSVSGVYAANLGEKSNEKSGRAIVARQQQGEIATFNYQDNMSKGVQRTWELFVDLIPRVIDTERALRILGPDGAEDYVRVNQVVPDPMAPGGMATVNDITRGEYDVTVTSGPSFATKRQEATELYGEMFANNPVLQQVASDLLFKAMDLPYAEDIAERFKAMLPPPIQAIVNKDKKTPPEVAQGMAQVQQAAAQVQQHGQLVQQAAGEAQQEKAAAEKAKADAQIASANLKAQAAEFKAQVADFRADQAEKQLASAQGESQQATSANQQVAAVVQQVGNAVAALEQRLAMLGQHTAAAVSEVHQAANRPPPMKPRLRAVRASRDRATGELVAIPEYEGAPSAMAPQAMPSPAAQIGP